MSVPEFSGAGTTIGGKNSRKNTDVLSLDYCTFRIPCEELRVKFKNGQKDLDKAAANVARAAELLTKKTSGANQPVPQETLRKNFDFLLNQVQEARKALENILEGEIGETSKIIQRCERLHEEFEVDEKTHPRQQDRMERQKFARYICWHLLRCGMIEPARELAKQMNLESLIDISVFEKIYEVEQALHAHDTKPCIEWCQYHQSRLRQIKSRMEVVARQQEIITLIEQGNIPEAVAYVKKYLVPIAKANFSDDLRKTMGAIAMPLEESRVRNPDFHDEKRYEKCAEFFIKEAYRLYQIPDVSALSVIVQMGLSAQKTPICEPDHKTPLSEQTCVVCRPDVWPLAEGLPYAHVDNARILCSFNGTVCNDDENIPYLFPSGHVIGLQAINTLKRDDNKIWDPIMKKEIEETEILRLYFM
ncbi:hypothetical protein GCK72_001784 [Caenorhabditis remanei]|uniref:E3 ubiquitin-protein transferase MAEA n=1 Tax=Caenorhabditis remanei TaxID=31234 RepID=A0A6A5HUK9_CAERE|nr:hypothetical protein GCK72_001784 [Caenorhabditis remanei]KAF1769967.1 hypothetical protein GCK72_001784 [Caenorhabditis remanei]